MSELKATEIPVMRPSQIDSFIQNGHANIMFSFGDLKFPSDAKAFIALTPKMASDLIRFLHKYLETNSENNKQH